MQPAMIVGINRMHVILRSTECSQIIYTFPNSHNKNMKQFLQCKFL